MTGRRLPFSKEGGASAVLEKRRSPFTTLYVAGLVATKVLLHLAPRHLRESAITASSTDVWHLSHDPVRVLVTSAFWLAPTRWWLPYVFVLLLVLVPLERRFGTRRVILIFLSGHVGATLLTELPVAAAIGLGWLPAAAAHRVDVGVSYGMYSSVGAYAGLLPTRARRLVLVTSMLTIAVPATYGLDMTSVGHMLALGIGACWWPRLRVRSRDAANACRGRGIGTGLSRECQEL